MAKLKFDSQKLKELLKGRVELVALGVAAGLALLLFATGILIALRTESHVKKSQELSKTLDSKFRSATPPEDRPADEKKLPEWAEVPVDRFPTVAWYHMPADTSPKRRNPKIRPPEMVTKVVNDGNESFIHHCLVFPVLGGVFKYEWNPRSDKVVVHTAAPAGEGAPGMPMYQSGGFENAMEPQKTLVAQRMALVVATFPYREQVKDFLKALRLDSFDELRTKGLLPTFVGLDVERGEPGPDGKVKWTALVRTDAKGKPVVDPGLKDLFKLSPLDTVTVQQYGKHMVHGADMPLPRLARGKYPKFELPGVTFEEVEAPAVDPKGMPKMPKMPGPGPGLKLPGGGGEGQNPAPKEGGGRLKEVKVTELPKNIQDQLKGKVDVWSPFGLPQDGADVKSGYPGYMPGGFPMPAGFKGKMPGFMQPPPGGKTPPEKAPGGSDEGKGDDGKGEDGKTEDATKGATTLEEVPEKILIRFIDVNLKPGQTYQYKLRVRMKNPNFGKDKEKEVAYPALAKVKELESPWVWTPLVTIPDSFAFYMMNQSPLATKLKTPKTIDWKAAVPPDKIPVQIHQFVETVTDEGGGAAKEIADWVIAERLLIGRGEVIGRGGVEVEVPVWDFRSDEFVLGFTIVQTGKGKTARTKRHDSVPIDFGAESPLVLADFWGGKVTEGNVEALLLGPDGSLFVRNYHEDSARPRTPEERAFYPFAAERQDRYDTWRARLERARPQPNTGGINMPGGKGPFPPGKGPFPPGKGPFPGKG